MQRSKKVKKYFLVLLILFAVYPAYCSTYFVATDGNDLNDGNSIDQPFKTIPQAVKVVSAGDTIYLRGGVHRYSSKISISKGGTAGNLITLQAYQDEAVILDFNDQPFGGNNRGIQLSGSSNYWHFKGFTIRYAGNCGLYANGSYNIFEQLVTHSNASTGLNLMANVSGCPAYNLVLNCDSYLNYDANTYGENADGFAAKGPTPPGGVPPPTYSLGPGNIFRGCRSWNNSDDGFDFWWAGNGVTVEDCWAFRNGVNIWGDPNFTGNGQGFKLGQGSGAHVLIRCMAHRQQHCGFDLNRSNGDTEPNGVTLYNCTGVRNLDKNFKFSNPSTGAIHVLRNNISHRGSVTIGTLIDNSYNTWNSGFSVSDADFASLDANGLDGPRGPNGELPKLSFLRLAPTSALIDAGTTTGLPDYMTYHGNAPDLGAFEYIDGDCQPDGDVDFADLECLTDNWLNSSCGTCNGADFSGDNKVNFADFVIMADNWLQ